MCNGSLQFFTNLKIFVPNLQPKLLIPGKNPLSLGKYVMAITHIFGKIGYV
jgi:hypothetical protein